MARSVKGPTSDVVEGTVAWFSPDDDRWPDDNRLTYDGQQKQRVVIPTNLAGGDYSNNDGGLVRANYNVFTEEFADLEDTYWWRISSGFGGFGVCVSEDAWAYAEEHGDEDQQDQVVAMLEALSGLASYPYLPGAKEEEFDVQMNVEIESWNDYGYREFRDALFGVLFSEDEEKLAETFEEALDAQEDQGRGILAAVYRGLGDLFSIYPEFEGSGDNIAPVYQFDSWAERLASLLSAWEQPGEENHLRLKILDDMTAHQPLAFAYNGEIYKVASWTKDKLGGAIVAKASAAPVVQDWIATQGGGAAAWDAILRGAKFSGLIPGGRPAGDRPDSDFDPIQRKGINVEMEHTSDRRVAKEIAKAHLTERPDYYVLLAKMEKGPRAKGFAGSGRPAQSLVHQYVEAAAKNALAARFNAPIKVQQRFYDRYMKLRNRLAEGWPHFDLDTGLDDAIAKWREAHPMFGPGSGW